MNKENCVLKLVDEIIIYYDARLKKHQITLPRVIIQQNDPLLSPKSLLTMNPICNLFNPIKSKPVLITSTFALIPLLSL